ncbi:FtsX-like permease family protein [Streptomyces sp. NPDC048290]|uniref:ABC transporter permease n=1 Tax=Streptomyces sp. NPDC048290 TaxID=3155811 RepID=UPI00343ECB93
MRTRLWARDLAMGVRFAFSGRGGLIRAALTAVGVGLGVTLLLFTTALPNALSERHAREEARQDYTFDATPPPKTDGTLLIVTADTEYRGSDVRGRIVEPEGPKAPLPPGVSAFPEPGAMVVSPALKELLDSSEGALLRERLPERIVGTIGEPGLIGSHELAFYRGGEGLERHLDDKTTRIDSFGRDSGVTEPWDPVLMLLVLVVFVVLLMPVAVFVAAAERFGSDGRDRRLAALRLVGSDRHMTRRIAAGEALAGSALGLVFGTVFFLVARQLAGTAEVFGFSVFPSYLNPSPLLAVLVALLVPAAAVVVTLLAMRGVVIEPLGVVRTAKQRRRRLWWRLLLPVAGLGLLAPMVGRDSDSGEFNQYLVVGGVVLLLVGVTALLPWLVERFVGRLGSGPVSWQLAVRRLQLSGGTAARTVNGIAVAVAGAIALQMLFTGVQDDFTTDTGKSVQNVQMQVSLPTGTDSAAMAAELRKSDGVRMVFPFSDGYLAEKAVNPEKYAALTVGDCAALRRALKLSSCTDGDVFATPNTMFDTDTEELAKEGRTLWLDPSYESDQGEEIPWKLPAVQRAAVSSELTGTEWGGLFVTPKALPSKLRPQLAGQIYLGFDHNVPDAVDKARTIAAQVEPLSSSSMWAAQESARRFDAVRTGLFVGAAAVLVLIGASLLVSQTEQLRERKKLLSVLVAFGTRRGTMTLSVLWQTAIPIALGLILANAVGLTLGAVLLRMTSTPIGIDWTSVLTMTGIGAAVVLAVTLLSLPPLLRLMRPEGLRTE